MFFSSPLWHAAQRPAHQDVWSNREWRSPSRWPRRRQDAPSSAPDFEFVFSHLAQEDPSQNMPLVVVDLIDGRGNKLSKQFSFGLDDDAFAIAKSIILCRYLPRTQKVYVNAGRQIAAIQRSALLALQRTRPRSIWRHKQIKVNRDPQDHEDGKDAAAVLADSGEDDANSNEVSGGTSSSMNSESELESDTDSNNDSEREASLEKLGFHSGGASQVPSGGETFCPPPSGESTESSESDSSQSDSSQSDSSQSDSSQTSASDSENSEPRTLSPDTRQLSMLSEARLERLEKLADSLEAIEKRSKTSLDFAWERFATRASRGETDSLDTQQAEAIATLSQCYGDLERLQYKAVDAIVTGDLRSGRDEARRKRKNLTKRITRLMNITEETVKRLKKK